MAHSAWTAAFVYEYTIYLWFRSHLRIFWFSLAFSEDTGTPTRQFYLRPNFPPHSWLMVKKVIRTVPGTYEWASIYNHALDRYSIPASWSRPFKADPSTPDLVCTIYSSSDGSCCRVGPVKPTWSTAPEHTFPVGWIYLYCLYRPCTVNFSQR